MSPTPAWVLDAETLSFRWANDAAVEFWSARDRAELFTRDVIASAPKPVADRIRDHVVRCRAGEHLREEWILYPGGRRRTVVLDIKAVLLASDEFGLLLQAQPLAGFESEALERNVAMHRHATVVLALASATGELVAQNPAAIETFGERDSWLTWFEDPREAERMLKATLADESQRGLLRARTRDGQPRWHLVVTQPLRDPVTTDVGVLIEHLDVSAQVEAEQLAETRGQRLEAVNATLELVERQRREILELSAPLLDVGDATLAVPIIGRLDHERHEMLMTKLLDVVAARGVRAVILDLTGIAQVDANSGERLLELIAALRLLGARATLTGLRPDLAQQLAGSGLALADVATVRSLARELGRHRDRGPQKP